MKLTLNRHVFALVGHNYGLGICVAMRTHWLIIVAQRTNWFARTFNLFPRH
jgi:hypothetical protein